MHANVTWYRTLAWKFFLRQAMTILVLISIMLGVAYSESGRGARAAAGASLAAGSQVLERTFEQQGRFMDAGLEVFTQYSGNLALIEQALEAGAPLTLKDALVDNLPRLGAELALVIKPDGSLLAASAPGAPTEYGEVGVLQMALAPGEAKNAGHPGPSYRGFFRVDWGGNPGIYHAVARPLYSPGGASLGAMLVGSRVEARAATDLRRLAIAGPQRGDPSAQLALMSHFRIVGTTLADGAPLDRLLARDPDFLAARNQILDNQRSSVLTLTLDGRKYLGMISPLRGVNALDLEMADFLLMPMDPLLAPFVNLQRGILGVGLAGIFLALGLGLHSARSVTAPLQALVTAADALAQGQAPATFALVPSTDEVGVLTRTFRSMLAELRAKDELLGLLDQARMGAAGQATGVMSHLSLPVEDATFNDPLAPTRQLPPAQPALQEEPLPAVLREGEVFAGRYRVESVLGRGGMGVVLRVRDLQLDEEVALKVIRAGLAADPAFLEQLKQEIRLARRITHRYVLRTHDFGEAEGIPYVTMEYLKGITLRSLLDGRGRLPLALVLRIARQVAEGLEAAHAVGVVHRDIKPMNVLFDMRGDAKIMDFGLAAPLATGDPGAAGGLQGTPRYMAPEQVRGERVDARADLYALGVMLFELSSGAPPFDSPRVADLLKLHLNAPIPALADLVPDAPRELGLLVARLMAKRQEDRPQSAAEVVEILKMLASGGGQSPA
jgi:serine/threonine-protein kinase